MNPLAGSGKQAIKELWGIKLNYAFASSYGLRFFKYFVVKGLPKKMPYISFYLFLGEN